MIDGASNCGTVQWRSQKMARESMGDFGERLLEALEKRNIDTFVLDLRFNTGGSFGLAKDLMVALQQRTKDISRVLITGRATFSAGISHVVS